MATTATDHKPIVVGRLRIPAEHVEEWRRLNEEIHAFIAAGKPAPKDLRLRSYILEGMAQADAEWFAEHGEMGECGDTHER